MIQLGALHDFTVVFFAPPIPPFAPSVYDTPQRRVDREQFSRFATGRRAALVLPDFPTTDQDFPDLWHIKQSLAVGYTQALCDAYAKIRP